MRHKHFGDVRGEVVRVSMERELILTKPIMLRGVTPQGQELFGHLFPGAKEVPIRQEDIISLVPMPEAIKLSYENILTSLNQKRVARETGITLHGAGDMPKGQA